MIYIYSHCVSELNLEIHDYINSFYVEQFDADRDRYKVLYVTYSSPDAVWWIHKHYPEIDYLPNYNDYLQRYEGGLWFYNDGRDKDIEEASKNRTLK